MASLGGLPADDELGSSSVTSVALTTVGMVAALEERERVKLKHERVRHESAAVKREQLREAAQMLKVLQDAEQSSELGWFR